MKKNVFESCPKYLGALTWNHPNTNISVSEMKQNYDNDSTNITLHIVIPLICLNIVTCGISFI